MTVLAAALAAATVLVLGPPWGWVRVRTAGTATVRLPRGAARTGAVGLVGLSLVLLPPAPTILAWTGGAVAALGWRRLRVARARRQSASRRDACGVLLDGLVAELRAGAPPPVAVARLAAEEPEWGPVAVVAADGGDVVAALRAAARRPGADLLATVADAWSVSEQTGATLAVVLERVRAAAREDRAVEQEVAAAVGPARATAVLMLAMPPVGLALGSGLGVDPLGVVTRTVPGALCVALGTAFALVGVAWIDRVADRVEVGS